MVQATLFQRREKYAKFFLLLISIIGGIVTTFAALQLDTPRQPIILVLMVIFLFVNEYYPMPVWKGYTTITFPVVYVVYLLEGLPYAIVVFAGVVLVVNILHHRPLRTVLFNPAQYILSLGIAEALLSLVSPALIGIIKSQVWFGISEFFLLMFFFYLLNNLFVDLVLIIRPQPYPVGLWKQKTYTELSSAFISLVYGILLYILGSQNRGEINDALAYFFFFSPLVGLSLLSSMIVRLKKEKKRLYTLSSMTTELNQMLPTMEWLQTLKNSFNEFINVEASILWVKEDGVWKRQHVDGLISENQTLTSESLLKFESVKEPIVITDRKKEKGIADSIFEKDLKSFVYAPLVIENETIGMFVVGRSRTKSFEVDDVRSLATLANQLAVVIKTRVLIAEQEKRILLEERNRIARDIHDGVAQTLAGAVMKLETASRKFDKAPDETMRLIQESVQKLRMSLKEVRESIYALRPYPTERIGLTTAIINKIESIKQEFPIDITFEIRGKEEQLSSMVEKVLYDTFRESVQNSIKHSKAQKIDVLLSYQTENILLKIKDDGVGFSLFQAMIKAQNKPHFGILQMNDAAEKISASLQIDSKENSGTEVTLTVPKMGFEGGNVDDKANVSG
ncbi:GAF domain-containing sensor histidine kinase [Bacillus timonensis]|nr:GAF domain-containing sensor histidine kinase [Bacillus timonensis]